MRVCDLHRDRPAVDQIILQRDDSRIDVCADCKTAALAVLNGMITLHNGGVHEELPGEVRKRGRPLKNLA